MAALDVAVWEAIRAVIEDPYGFIDQCFAQTPAADEAAVQRLFDVQDRFRAIFASDAHLDAIPSLNHAGLHAIKPGTLVRFRCMVQDMLDAEFYAAVYPSALGARGKACGMFRDAALGGDAIDYYGPGNVTGERAVLYCVPVPGESSWVGESWKATDAADPILRRYHGQNRGKRSADDAEPAPDVDAYMDADTGVALVKPAATSPEALKRARTAADAASQAPDAPAPATAAAAAAADIAHPLSDPALPGSVVKIYHDNHGLKLNDVVELYAILTHDPTAAITDIAGDAGEGAATTMMTAADFMDAEFLRAQPSSNIPRLHCLAWTHLTPINANPLFRRAPSPWTDHSLVQSTVGPLPALRGKLVEALAMPFGGDQLVAEYLLLHMLSSVYGRVDTRSLGRLLLNVTGCPRAGPEDYVAPAGAAPPGVRVSELGRAVHATIQAILPRAVAIGLTLDYLNSAQFTPKKAPETNRLTPGVLQLCTGTQLTVDETVLNEGRLESNGVSNLQALKDMMELQEVKYDLPFQQLSFTTDLPVLVLSEGNSMLPVDCTVRMQATSSIGVPWTAATEPFLAAVRTYLAIARSSEYTIEPEMAAAIQGEFVQSRRQAAATGAPPGSLKTQDDLYRELALARLIALSFGDHVLTRERWQHMRALESQRLARVRPTPAGR